MEDVLMSKSTLVKYRRNKTNTHTIQWVTCWI